MDKNLVHFLRQFLARIGSAKSFFEFREAARSRIYRVKLGVGLSSPLRVFLGVDLGLVLGEGLGVDLGVGLGVVLGVCFEAGLAMN